MSAVGRKHTQGAGDVLAVGEGDRCNCVNHAGAYSAVGACACPLHGMKALRAEVERLRLAPAYGPQGRWTQLRRERDAAVVEVERLRTALLSIAAYTQSAPHTRMGEACGIDACIGCLIQGTAAEVLASSSAGDALKGERG